LSGTLVVAAVSGEATFSDISIDKAGTGYTLDATAGGLSTATSASFDITVGAATQLVFSVEPTNAVSTVAISPAIKVQVHDAGGNLVPTATDSITLAINNNPSSGTLSGTLVVAAVSGKATFSNISIDKVGTGYTLDATAGGLSTATSAIFDITVGTATQLAFSVEPVNTAATVSVTPAIKVQVHDAGGNLVPTATNSITLAINSNPSSGTLSGTLVVAAVSGEATFSDISIDKVGTGYTVDATAGGLGTATSASFDITVGTATQLVFSVEPANAVSTVAISPAIKVQVLDAGGNLVPTATNSITLAINSNPSSGTLSGTMTVAAVSGEATFSDISIDKVGTGYTLDATAGGLSTATSGSFDITVGAATQLVFSAEPTSTVSTVAISPAIKVQVLDAGGNLVPTATDSITLAINSNPSSGTLSGTLVVAAVSGEATFSDISVDKAGTGYTLDATAGGLSTATSAGFNITVGVATQLVYSVEPTNTVSTVAVSPAVKVQVHDAGGNLVPTATDSITLAINSNPSSGTLSGTLVVAAVSGEATFSDISIDKVGTGYTLDATAGGLSAATSASFDITVGVATQLVYSVEPTNTVSTVAVSPAIKVQVHDAGGNLVPTATDSITLAINSNPSSGTLSGTLVVAAVSGEATFSDISIDKVGTGYTLDATAGGLSTATSTSFNITVGTATQLVISVEPTNAVSTVAISPAIKVQVHDAGGNLVPTATDSITLTINSNPSSGTLSGTLVVAAVSGEATFSNLSIDKVGTGYTLDATAGGLSTATSASFDITVGSATQLAFSVEPVNTTATSSVTPAIKVQVQDAGGNLVPTATDSITLAINNDPGSGTLSGTLIVAALSGEATFSDISIDKVGTGYTLDATAGGLSTATSASFDITVGTATQLVFSGEPTNTVSTVAISPAIKIQVHDAGGNLVPTGTDSITLAINSNPSSGTLSGTLVVAAVSGEATFSDISIDKVGTGYTLDATAGGLTTATSASFDITVGGATQVVITVPGSDFSAGGNTNLTVQIHDAGGNLVPTDSTTAVTFDPTLSGTISAVVTGSGDGSYGVVGGAETVTVAGGVATVTLADTVTETFEVAITNDALLANPANDSITVTTVSDHMLVTSMDGAATTGATEVLSLQLVDVFGNPANFALPVTVTVSGSATFSANDIGGSNGSNSLNGTLSASGSGSVTITNGVAETVSVAADATGDPEVLANEDANVQFNILAALDFNDSRLFYGQGGLTEGIDRTWDDSLGTWSLGSGTPEVGGTIKWTVNKVSPSGGEELLGVLSDTGAGTDLRIMRWDGTKWNVDSSSVAILAANAGRRGFDVEYESLSEEGLVVYSDNTANPAYMTRTGGSWNMGSVFGTAPGSGTVLWVELVRRPGSDEIALVYADSNFDLFAVVWDGTSWDVGNAATLEQDLASVNTKAIDAAYETLTGNLLVVWGVSNDHEYSTKAAGLNSFTAGVSVGGGFSGRKGNTVDLASEASGNRIALATRGGVASEDDFNTAMWNGGSWINLSAPSDGTGVNPGSGDMGVAAGWVGTSGTAIAVYSSSSGQVDWSRWSAGGGWVVQADIPVAGMGDTESVQMESFTGQDKVMAGEIATVETALVGSTLNTSCVAVPTVISKLVDVAVLSPLAVASNM